MNRKIGIFKSNRESIASLLFSTFLVLNVLFANIQGSRRGDIRPKRDISSYVSYINKKPVIIEAPESTAVIAKEPMLMRCLVDGNPAPLVQWTASGIDDKIGEPIKTSRGSILKIPSVPASEHLIRIGCSSLNPLGKIEYEANLKVYNTFEDAPAGFPQFTHDSAIIIRQKNEEVDLACRVTGDPKPTITWYKNYSPITIDHSHYNTTPTGTLMIRLLNEDDEGVYMCEAKNIHGSRISPEQQLLVRENLEATIQRLLSDQKKFLPRFLSIPSKRVIVRPGSKVTLTCTADGNPEPKVNWFRKSIKLGSSSNTSGASKISLIDVTQSENITCHAKSSIGSVSHSVNVLVKDIEYPPEKLYIGQITAHSIRIAIQPSLVFKGNVHVTGYLLHWTKGDFDFDELKNFIADDFRDFEIGKAIRFSNTYSMKINKDEKTLNFEIDKAYQSINLRRTGLIMTTIEGLDTFTEYKIVARALLSDGFCSELSTVYTFKTSEMKPLDEPRNVSVLVSSTNAVTISWLSPRIPNGLIKVYKILYESQRNPSKQELSTYRVLDQELYNGIDYRFKTSVDRLHSNNLYNFKIVAVNSAGESPPSKQVEAFIKMGVLSAPRNLSVSVKSYDEVEINWHSPNVPENLISAYLLQIFRVEEYDQMIHVKNVSLTNDRLSALITNLTPDTKYLFKISAVSNNVDGLTTEASAKTIDYVAPTPYKMNLTATSSTSLNLEWYYPQDDMSISADGRDWKVPKFINFNLVLQATDANGQWIAEDDTSISPEERYIERTIQLQSGGVFDSLNSNDGLVKYSEHVVGLKADSFYIAYLRVKTILGYGLRAASLPTKTWANPPGRPIEFIVKTYQASSKNKYSIEATWKADNSSNIMDYRLAWMYMSSPKMETTSQNDKTLSLTSIESSGLILSKAQPSLIRVSVETFTNASSWHSADMEHLPGAKYNFSLLARTANQLGEAAYYSVTIPEISPIEAPINLRVIKSGFNQNILFWDPMSLNNRGGPFHDYVLSCKDRHFSITNDLFKDSYNWPSGYAVIDQLLPTTTGEVYCKVSASNTVGRSPWSKPLLITLDKKLPPAPPINIRAVRDGASVFVSWTCAKNNTGVLIKDYQIDLGQKTMDEEIAWNSILTNGPSLSKEIKIDSFNPPNVLRVKAISFDKLHSLSSSLVNILNSSKTYNLPINLNAITCSQKRPNSFDLVWSYNEAVSSVISHFKINYTFSSIFTHSNGLKYKRQSTEREIIEYPNASVKMFKKIKLSPTRMHEKTTELTVFPNAIYKISIVPILVASEDSSYGQLLPPVSHFNCPISNSQAPVFVNKPIFMNETGRAYLVISKVSPINGPIDFYEVLSNRGGRDTVELTILTNTIDADGEENFKVELTPKQRHKRSPENAIQMGDLTARFSVKACSVSFNKEENLCSQSDWADPSDIVDWLPRPASALNMVNFKKLIEAERNLWPSDTITLFTSTLENSPQLDDSNQQRKSISPVEGESIGNLQMNNFISNIQPKITLRIVAIIITVFIVFFTISCLFFAIIVRVKRKKHIEREQKSSKYSLIKWSNTNTNNNNRGTAKGSSLCRLETDQLSSVYKTCSNQNRNSTTDSIMNQQMMNNFMYSTYNGEMLGVNTQSLSGMNDNFNNILSHGNTFETNSVQIPFARGRQGSINSLNGSISGRNRLPMSPQIGNLFNNRPQTSLFNPVDHKNNIHTEFITSVKSHDLYEHVSMLKMNSGRLLSVEFENIDPGGQYTWEHSVNPVNAPKNRYANVVAYDHTRVRLAELPNQPGSDYINANYIDGFMKKQAYIATQGPLESTIESFWRMVWENNSCLIIAMTNLEEKSRIKCDQYWPNQIKALPQNDSNPNNTGGGDEGTFYRSSNLGTMTYGSIQIKVVDFIELAYYTRRIFEVTSLRTNEKRVVKQYQYTGWSDHFIPNNAGPFYMFLREVRNLTRLSVDPIVVHCSAGVGRTGAFIASDILLNQLECEDAVNVYDVVTKLRSQRKFMIQTEEQYRFIYETLLENIDSFDKRISVSSYLVCAEKSLIRSNRLAGEFSLLNNRTITSSISDPLCNVNKGLLCPIERGKVSDVIFKMTSSYRMEASPMDNNLVAVQPMNIQKNRSLEIVPYNLNRVVLAEIRGLPGSDYINASLIDGYGRRLEYIATQAPLEETFEDYWRMIWEAEVRIIVKLNTDCNLETRRAYWPISETLRFGFLMIESIAVFEMNHYKIREFSITDTREGHSRTVRQFDVSDALCYIPMNSDDFSNVPKATFGKVSSALIECIDQVNITKVQFGIESPVLVHCEFGAGFTGVYICLSILLEMIQAERSVDIFSVVKMLRWQRRGLVENILDYMLCYSTILEYLTNYN